jgi:hypothetical protein
METDAPPVEVDELAAGVAEGAGVAVGFGVGVGVAVGLGVAMGFGVGCTFTTGFAGAGGAEGFASAIPPVVATRPAHTHSPAMKRKLPLSFFIL